MDQELLNDLNSLDKTLREENLNLRNRLLSIHHDVKFYQRVRSHFPQMDVMPNARCGIWYIPPEDYTSSVYFKSTDGHTNNWGFSIRRLNFTALTGQKLIIDSTRRGKRSPDSLSKTIPIWCSVLNSVFDKSTNYDRELQVDESCVSNLEREMILDKLIDTIEPGIRPYFDSVLNIDALRGHGMDKKLRAFFVSPSTNIQALANEVKTLDEEYSPLVLVTVSEMSRDGEDKSGGFCYVQGAGDDHELWSGGLSPSMFWANQNLLSEVSLRGLTNNEIVNLVNGIVEKEVCSTETTGWTKWDISPTLSFGSITPKSTIKSKEGFERIIVLESSVKSEVEGVFVHKLESNSKKSSKLLRVELPKIVQEYHHQGRTLVLCSTGGDLSPCVAITLSLMGTISDKVIIRTKLAELTSLNPLVNPQRGTLNSINSFLMK